MTPAPRGTGVWRKLMAGFYFGGNYWWLQDLVVYKGDRHGKNVVPSTWREIKEAALGGTCQNFFLKRTDSQHFCPKCKNTWSSRVSQLMEALLENEIDFDEAQLRNWLTADEEQAQNLKEEETRASREALARRQGEARSKILELVALGRYADALSLANLTGQEGFLKEKVG